MQRHEQSVWASARRLGMAAAVFVLLALQAVSVGADEVSLRADSGSVYLRFRLDHVLSDGVLEPLESGLPTRVLHRLQIWQRRSALWDRRVIDEQREYRVVFDLIEETYDLFDEQGLLESNLEGPEVEERLSSRGPASICATDRLDPDDHYYAVVEIVVEPLSIEEVRDLESWLSGSLRDGDGQGVLSRFPEHLVGILKSRIGLGERRHEVRSSVFRPRDLRPLDGGS